MVVLALRWLRRPFERVAAVRRFSRALRSNQSRDMESTLELGLDTFGDVTVDADGRPLSHAQVIRNVVERPCSPIRSASISSASASTTAPTSPISAPEVVLAAIAGRTERIQLGSAVTVLSSDDPDPRLPALRHARRRVERARRGDPRPRVVHRVVPAVRLSARQYETLFEEKLDLFAAAAQANAASR